MRDRMKDAEEPLAGATGQPGYSRERRRGRKKGNYTRNIY